MLLNFFKDYQNELIISGILLISLLIIRFIIHFTITKVARNTGINEARIRLIRRYITVTIFLFAVLIESFIFGTEFKEIAVVFSSIFAVIGIGLFAPL